MSAFLQPDPAETWLEREWYLRDWEAMIEAEQAIDDWRDANPDPLELWSYDPETDTWTHLENTPRYLNWQHDPETNAWTFDRNRPELTEEEHFNAVPF